MAGVRVMDKRNFLNYVNDSVTVIEAGANKGYDTIGLSQVFKNGIVYGIEPIKHHFDELTKRTINCPNIKLFNFALHNKNGTAEMFVSSGKTIGSDTLLEPKEHLRLHPDIYFNDKQKTKTITLDRFVKDNNITGDIVCWFDMEGNEYNVLSASKTAINQIKLIYTEYSIVERYSGLCLFDDFSKFLLDKGFTLVYNETIYNYLGMGNAMFVRK
jgi:FkbM family methyltransferase